MTNAEIVTGHEVEIAEIAKQSESAERSALTIKMSGEEIAKHGEVLRLSALGKLLPINENIFGESESVLEQVEAAKRGIALHISLVVNAMAGND